MDYFRRFNFLFAAPVFDADDLEGIRFNQIIAEIERSGFEVVRARKLEDAEIAVQTDAAIGCMVVDWGKKGLEGKTAALINLMRRRGLDFPIILLIRRKRFEDLPVEVLDFIDGYVFLSEETPPFIAKNLISRLKQYAETLKTPFFGALVDYAEEGNQLWTCPGHNGGVFYNRSPIGRVFVEHLGEAVFRDDLDNSVLDLGDLLTHEGPALKAQKEAAQIFGAEKTYFVLNGTSTSNKVALGALVTDGDLVLFDRNNHKAAHHGALMIAGGIPVYVPTVRNAWGLIGPMRWDALDETALRERIRNHPLVKDKEAWRKPRPFRVAVVEQCTYDGTIHSAEMILKRIGHLCDYILFDEAWAGFMKFHPLYAGRFAMGLAGSRPRRAGHHRDPVDPQAARELLAGLADPHQGPPHPGPEAPDRAPPLQRELHAARLDLAVLSAVRLARCRRADDEGPLRRSAVGRHDPARHRAAQEDPRDAARVRGEGDAPGTPLVLRAVRARPRRDPRRLAARAPCTTSPGRRISTDLLATNPSYWQLAPDAVWHGFPDLAAGFAMTDPNKLTLLTPGFDRATGAYAEHGIPAPVVAQYLRENRIVAEKNDLNSLLFLLTPGVEASKAGTLISGLVAFKKLHDDNALLEDVIPEFYQRRPARYAGVRLRDLCARDAPLLPRRRRQRAAGQAVPCPSTCPRSRCRRAMRRAIWCATTSTICRSTRSPGRIATTPVRGLSARHRHHRAGRAAHRTGAAHDRLSQDVRNLLQHLSRLRRRNPGRLQGGRCVRPHPALHLRGFRMKRPAKRQADP